MPIKKEDFILEENKEELKLCAHCKSCIKRDLHCCKEMPLFSNKEIVKLLEDEVLEKLGYVGKIVIWRYLDNAEIFTILYKGENFRAYEKGKKECIFLDKEKGCKLGKYMPNHCKYFRAKNDLYHCAYIDLTKEEFDSKSDEELNKLQEQKALRKDIYFSTIFDGFLKRFRKRKKKKLKITKDDVILALAFHALNCNFEELEEEGILKKEEKEIFDIEDNGGVIVYKIIRVKPLSDNSSIISYVRKINFLLNNLYNNKLPMEIDILINITQSFLDGVDKIPFKDEELEKDFKGILLANTILLGYKNDFKMKNKKFAGLIPGEQLFENMEEFIYNKLEEKGLNYIEIIEILSDFVEKFIKRVIKGRI